MALSRDLRVRILGMVQGGASRRTAAAHFGVSASSAIRFVQRFETEGHVEVKPRSARKRRLDPYREDLLSWIKEAPDLTLEELSQRMAKHHGVRASTSTLHDWLRAQGLSFKKNGTRQ